MKTVGRFLDCYHQICLRLSPTVLLFRFSHACLLERSSFVACCYTSCLASKFSLMSCSFCLLFLLSHFLLTCLLALFSFPNYFSFPVLLSKVFFYIFLSIPSSNYKDTNFSSNHIPFSLMRECFRSISNVFGLAQKL